MKVERGYFIRSKEADGAEPGLEQQYFWEFDVTSDVQAIF